MYNTMFMHTQFFFFSVSFNSQVNPNPSQTFQHTRRITRKGVTSLFVPSLSSCHEKATVALYVG